jgi:hypothetical protein
MSKGFTRRALAGLAMVAVLGCGSDSNEPNDPNDPEVTIEDFITRVATADGGNVAVLRTGELPAEGDGPAITTSSAGTVINGGSARVTVESAGDGLSRLYIALDGVEGYWELTLDDETLAEIILSLAADLDETSLDAIFGAGGEYATQTFSVTEVGTGDVQVSVSWTGASDVDLHVVDPNGEEIYYGHRTSPEGGELDLDSNAGCSIDNVNNENIVYPTGEAVRGEYIVRVDYWSGCDAERSDYVVTVRVKGREPQTFSGSFTGAGDQGGAGSGVEITRFTY